MSVMPSVHESDIDSTAANDAAYAATELVILGVCLLQALRRAISEQSIQIINPVVANWTKSAASKLKDMELRDASA